MNLDVTYAPAVNTGFHLLPGDRVSISATGTTQWCNGCNIVGPDGEVPCGGLGIPFPCGSYAGVIGGGDIYTDYWPFFQLGTGPTEITAASEGCLYLQYVDGRSSCVNDNTGGFTVTVTSCTGRCVT